MEKFEIPSLESKATPEKLARWRGHWQELARRAILAASLATSMGLSAEVQAQPREPSIKPRIELKQDTRENFLNKYRQNFELMRAETEREKSKEKLETLKQKYGGSINNFLSIRRIERDLEFLDTVEKGKDNPEIFVGSDPRFMTPGSILSSAYETRWQKPEIRQEEFTLENLSEIPGFNETQFRQLLTRYPDGYLKGSLSGVQYDSEVNIRGGTEILGETKGYDIDRLLTSDTRSPIVIYNTTQGVEFTSMLEVFTHELGHANDWQNSHLLTSTERISMLFEVGERAEAEDRYQSSYVEAIDTAQSVERTKSDALKDTTPEQLLAYIKALEYWAEIAKAHFENPDQFKMEHPKDSEVVQKWVARSSYTK